MLHTGTLHKSNCRQWVGLVCNNAPTGGGTAGMLCRMRPIEYGADDTRGYGVTSLAATLLAIAVSGRSDVKVDVNPGIPAVGELPVQVQNNQVKVFGSVFAPLGAARFVPLDQYVTRYQMPALAGAVIAGTVWATKPPLPPASAGWDPEVREAAELLGRVRAEARHIQRRTTDWVLLSSGLPRVVTALLSGGAGAAIERRVLSTLLGEVLVRVASGVLPSSLAARCLEVVGQRLPADTFQQVATVCTDLGALPDGHHDELETLAHEWVAMIHRLLPDAPTASPVGDVDDCPDTDDDPDGAAGDGAKVDDSDADGEADEEGAGEVPDRGSAGAGIDDDAAAPSGGVPPGGAAGEPSGSGSGSGVPDEPRGDFTGEDSGVPTDVDTGGFTDGFYLNDDDPWEINDLNPIGEWPDLNTPCELADALTDMLDQAAAEADTAAEKRRAGLTAPVDPTQGLAAAAHNAGLGVFLGATSYNTRPVVRFKSPTTSDHHAANELLTQLR